jgi:hypothetical protein
VNAKEQGVGKYCGNALIFCVHRRRPGERMEKKEDSEEN